MTTVKTFQGLSSEKSSSRVAQPPGGKSSFSFSDGSAPEPTQQRGGRFTPAQAAPAQAAPAPAPQSYTRGPAPVQGSAPSSAAPSQGYRVTQPPGGRSSNIFG